MTDTVKKQNAVGPRSRKIFEDEGRHMAPGLQSFALYSGLAMARGRGSRLYDEDGNEYIDFIAGIAVGSVGHCHPHYVARLKEQAEKLTFGSFTTQVRATFLELLASVTPPGLTRIQLFSGGAEAVEATLRLAKSVTGKYEFVGYTGAFHGKTGGVLPLLWGDFKKGLGPFAPGYASAPYAYCYRCPLSLTYPDCGLACAEKTREVLRDSTSGAVAAILIEPMQGTAGNVIPPPGFLAAIQSIAKEHGALLIVDEMITGFGRTGRMWGVDHDGVVPDVMTVGKGIGGGFPLSGLVSTDELTAHPPFSNPSGSSSSYGGNPLASAAGLASLEIITRENLVENSEKVGRAMLAKLERMKEKHRVIGDVRGKGMLLGLELVEDRKTKKLVSKEKTKALFQECLRRGLVAMSYTPVIRINPPLNTDEATALEGLELLDEAIGAVFPPSSSSGIGNSA
jgi:4-aminobutyrate aminotransferase/(S)-3-amino-2-methylpropionate transaminase